MYVRTHVHTSHIGWCLLYISLLSLTSLFFRGLKLSTTESIHNFQLRTSTHFPILLSTSKQLETENMLQLYVVAYRIVVGVVFFFLFFYFTSRQIYPFSAAGCNMQNDEMKTAFLGLFLRLHAVLVWALVSYIVHAVG